MSNDIIHKCCVCEADFRPGALDKNGKCPKKEAMALNRPEIHLGEKLDAEKVRQIVKEELNAFKAEQKVDRMAKARAAKQDKKNDNKGDE